MVAQTNHQTTKYATENKWHGDLFTNGENLHSKNPTGLFLGHHSQNSTIITTSSYSKGIPIPYTNLQLDPYSNTQLDLFCSDNFPFWCTAPKYMTNQLRES